MIVIDPRKVFELSEVFDYEVAELCIRENCSRTEACVLLAQNDYESYVSAHTSPSGWINCVAIEGSANLLFQEPFERVALGSQTPEDAARWLLACSVVGRDYQAVASAALLKLLDPSCDIEMDWGTFQSYYGPDEVLSVIDAVAPCLCADCRSSLITPSLFEDSFSLDDKISEAAKRVFPLMRQQMCAWADVMSNGHYQYDRTLADVA